MLSVDNIVEQTGVPTAVQTTFDFDLNISDSVDGYIFGGETPSHLTNLTSTMFHFSNPGFETSSALKLTKKISVKILLKKIFFLQEI